MKPTLVEPQSPCGYGKVPFATSGPSNSTNTGDNHKNNYKNIILEIKNTLVYLQLKRWASQYQHLRHELHFQWGPNLGCALPPGAEGRQCQPGNLQEGTVDIHDVGSASLGRRPNGHQAQDPPHFRRPHLHQTDQVPLLWKDARRCL